MRIHYIANDYSLSMLFIMIENLSYSCVLIALHFYIKSHSCSSPKLSSAFLAWFSHLHLILYARVPKLLRSEAFLTASCLLLFPRWSVAVCSSGAPLPASGHFNNRWYSLSSAAHRRHQTLPVHPSFYCPDCQPELCYASSFFQSAEGCLRLSSTGVLQTPI